MEIIINWLIVSLAILVANYILTGVEVSGLISALLVALVLGIVNAFIKPILLLLTLPINILTLGLFTLVINALLVMLTSAIVPGFEVKNFWWALLFSLAVSVIIYFVHLIFR